MKKRNPNYYRLHADVEDVLGRLGIDFTSRDCELTARCMFGSHPDKTPSWSIHNEAGDGKNGVFCCMGCKWAGDVYELVMKVRGCGFLDALDFVKKSQVKRLGQVDEDDDYEGIFRDYEPYEIKKPKGVVPILRGSSCLRYLSRRGIGWEEITRYGLMDWRWQKRVYIPITRSGTLISWVARSYNRDTLKVRTPKGEWLGSTWGLFGLDQANRTDRQISLTESWASSIRVGQGGFVNPIGSCGSVLTEEQTEDLSWARRIIFWQEGDVAGRIMARDVKIWLGRGRIIEIVKMPKKKDPENFLPGELVNFYNRR